MGGAERTLPVRAACSIGARVSFDPCQSSKNGGGLCSYASPAHAIAGPLAPSLTSAGASVRSTDKVPRRHLDLVRNALPHEVHRAEGSLILRPAQRCWETATRNTEGPFAGPCRNLLEWPGPGTDTTALALRPRLARASRDLSHAQ
jgi:hypothetical protein